MSSIKNNRVVIITGVSQGLGYAITQTYLKHGDIVIGCASSVFESNENVSALKQQYPDNFFYFTVDLTCIDAITQFVKKAEMLFGRIDIVVSNAGRNVFKGIDCSEEDWQYNFDLNLRSHWHLAKCARPALDKTKGVILIMTSNHAFYTMKGCAPYNISKCSLLALVQSLAIEWGPEIRTVGIAPGYIDTEGCQLWFDAQPDPELSRQIVADSHPVGRIGTPSEVGDVCLFLSSHLAGFISGTTITMDGGRSALMQD
jgi:NAD(P)-dependent dehydrogenase (short-subunit alcohol dehydrogenase family)